MIRCPFCCTSGYFWARIDTCLCTLYSVLGVLGLQSELLVAQKYGLQQPKQNRGPGVGEVSVFCTPSHMVLSFSFPIWAPFGGHLKAIWDPLGGTFELKWVISIFDCVEGPQRTAKCPSGVPKVTERARWPKKRCPHEVPGGTKMNPGARCTKCILLLGNPGRPATTPGSDTLSVDLPRVNSHRYPSQCRHL